MAIGIISTLCSCLFILTLWFIFTCNPKQIFIFVEEQLNRRRQLKLKQLETELELAKLEVEKEKIYFK